MGLTWIIEVVAWFLSEDVAPPPEALVIVLNIMNIFQVNCHVRSLDLPYSICKAGTHRFHGVCHEALNDRRIKRDVWFWIKTDYV